MVDVCILTGHGVNAEAELATGFERSGGQPELVYIGDLIRRPALLERYQIVAFPGGFSFGDHIGSGLVLATILRERLREPLERYIGAGGLCIGICNGFQALVKAGILPNIDGTWQRRASLIHNRSGVFEDRWVRVRFGGSPSCVWTAGLEELEMPVRHGEGRFVARADSFAQIERAGLIVGRYAPRRCSPLEDGRAAYPDDPNGSMGSCAAMCDPTGRIFGLMPHPEAFLDRVNHPQWTRAQPETGNALGILINGVRAASSTG